MSRKADVVRNRHKRAREQREFYKDKFPDEKQPDYFDFFRNETPLTKNVISYDVSYQLNYRGEQDHVTSTRYTFTVYGLIGQEIEIQNRTMNMLVDSKGKITGNRFNKGVITKLEENKNNNIRVTPRGMEESNRKPDSQIINDIIKKGYVVKELDTDLKFKNKRKGQGEMELDIRHFIK